MHYGALLTPWVLGKDVIRGWSRRSTSHLVLSDDAELVLIVLHQVGHLVAQFFYNGLGQLQPSVMQPNANLNCEGIAMYIKENMSYKCMHNYEKFNIEAMWVSIISVQSKILICCCYQPPDKREFGDEFHNCSDDVKNYQIKKHVLY